MERFIRAVSCGQHVWSAALLYMAMASLMLAMASPTPPALAQGESACPTGEKDCSGVCIPESDVCCADGTHGSSSTCTCCTGCVNSSNCATIATVICESDVEEWLE